MRVESLTFLRFVAALIVVIFHFGREVTGFTGTLISGPEMVTFFFVLSGFVMALTYTDKSDISAASYWWARASRIMPVYLLAVALMTISIALKDKELNPVSLILNITLLQSWFPSHPLTINPPGWSLSVEAFFYLMFPAILAFIRKNNLSNAKLFLIAMSLWGTTQAFLVNIISNGLDVGVASAWHDIVNYFPLSHLCSFLLGISGGIFYATNNFRITNSYQSIFIVVLAVSLVVFTLNNEPQISNLLKFSPAYASSFLAPLFLVFIVSISICQSKAIEVLNVRPLVLLGESSFSLYILQIPVNKIYNLIAPSIFKTSTLLDFCIYVTFLITVSILSFLYYEKPMNKYLRQRQSLSRCILSK